MVQGNERADLAATRDDAVHLGRLALGATEALAVLLGSLDEHDRPLPDALGDAGPAGGISGVAQHLGPLGLLVLVDLVRQVEGGGALLAGVGEDADVMEQPLGDEIEELLELLVGLAGKSRDERCAQGDVGHRGLDALDEGAKRRGIPSTVHGAEDRLAHVLQGMSR